jgi:glucose-6-phosphate 1-dehydrogenase
VSDVCTFVIFGATGHLSRNKLLPALYNLEKAGRLTEGTAVLGVGRRPWDSAYWRDQVHVVLESQLGSNLDEAVFSRFRERLHFFSGDLDDPTALISLKETLEREPVFNPNIVFYLALMPAQYGPVARSLAENGLNRQTAGWRRLVVEKPFGYDMESARMLNQGLHSDFDEGQIYRIDHYLGKETVQNVLVFRFANLMLEPLWNRNYIDHVQITHSETAGIEGRAGYFDGAGALRDMIQSHLLQMLTIVAMEPPPNLDAESLRDEKVKVLKSIRPIPQTAVHAHTYRAQYVGGVVKDQEGSVPGYLEEPGVPAHSATETYAALKLYIDNWRWRNVPFFLRTGKRLARKSSMISIRFKHPPQQLFRETQIQDIQPNWLLLGIQPEQCIRAEMQVKEQGLEMRTTTTQLDAGTCSHETYQLDAYETLLLDVIDGDHSLFLRYDEVNWAWEVVDPVLKVWATERDFVHTYLAGSWGPTGADRVFERDDQMWRNSLADESEWM